jgi:hypothetical protein
MAEHGLDWLLERQGRLMQRTPQKFAYQTVFLRRKNTVWHMNFILDTVLCGAFPSAAMAVPSMAAGAEG